jgi:colanic acid biosynthesis glycosyl transferase WcaI
MRSSNPTVTVVGLNYVPELTGIAPYTAGLASGLAERGWEINAVTAYPHYPAWKIAPGYGGSKMHERLDGVKVTRVRPYMPRNPSGVKRLLVELSFGIRSVLTSWSQPEVVILVSPALFASAIAIVRARLSPRRPSVVLWVQDLYSLGVAETGTLGSFGARIMSSIEAYILRRADKVVVIHDRFRRHVVGSLGVKNDHVSVVRNWTHLSGSPVSNVNYRVKFGWGDDLIILHAGNMGAKQALETVIESARLADEDAAPIRFVLLGGGNQRDALVRLGAGIQRLQFLDSLSEDDFIGAMGASDILLVNEKPGVAEMAVPSKLTSYFSARRPVIAATDAGSITADEITAAGAGVRVNAGDPRALLLAALELGANDKLRASMGESGARFQEDVLSRQTAIAHYAEIISSLAVKRGH